MRRCVVVLAALVLASGFAGCSRIIGQPYDNFTAYYNTFYNAKQAFEREEEQLLTAERPVDRNLYLSLFIEPEGTRQADGFAKAVEKGADLLREHPESKWVDDALLLIGKAYFYQGNFTGAEQKFRETIELEEDRLEDEARLWLGRTLTASERYEDAALTLREGLDREGVREEWAGQMRLALAEVDVREAEWDEAVESLQAGLDGTRDDELAARAAFLLGQVYETLGRPIEAAEAYERVLDYGPRYQLSYAAQLSRAITLGLGGEGEQALDALRRMARDDKNFENRAEIELARAQVLNAVGRAEEARDRLRTLLYDPDPSLRIGSVQGQIHYRLAEVYRDGLRNYVRAAAHYDTAATAIRRPDLLDTEATAQAITDAVPLAETFGNYARVSAEIAEMDSLLYLGSLDDDAFAAAIEEIREQRAREAEEEARELERRRSEQGFGGGPGLDGFDEGARGTGTSDAQTGGGSQENAGFLNYRNPVRVQEELIAFQARWGDRPLVPNWRRAAAIGGGVAVQEGVAETLGDVPNIDTPIDTREDFVDISGIPRDPFTQQRMRENRAAARYELGNVLFLSLSEPDSASVLYRSVLEDEVESPLAQRAYFALAEAQRALGNTAEAERLYREIIDRYPDSPFAGQARGELGLAPVEETVAADSLGLAEAAYESAYAQWQEGAYTDAMEGMLALSGQYPTTPAAARARLAAGAIYTEWASGNEEVLLASEPLALTGDVPPPRPQAETPEPPRAADAPAPDAPQRTVDVPSGYTWIVASEADSLAAVQVAEAYLARGFDAFIVPRADESSNFRVGIGQFPARAEARAARAALPDDAPEDTWLLRIPAVTVPAPIAAAPEPEETPVTDDVPPAPDSTLAAEPVAADSAAVASAPTGVAADSVSAPVEEGWLETLYASVETDFPGTPFAERARNLREALNALRSGEALADTAAMAEGARADSLRAVEIALRGSEPLDAFEGSHTWSIYSSPAREFAEEILRYTAEAGYRTALYTEDAEDDPTYHVVVGQFTTEEAAEAVQSEIERIPDAENPVVLELDPGAVLEPSTELLQRGDQ